jgi:predicted O-methyltransferase YrrM
VFLDADPGGYIDYLDKLLPKLRGHRHDPIPPSSE